MSRDSFEKLENRERTWLRSIKIPSDSRKGKIDHSIRDCPNSPKKEKKSALGLRLAKVVNKSDHAAKV